MRPSGAGELHVRVRAGKRTLRIKGQTRGLQTMVEDDKYCIDILTQGAAVTKTLQPVALGLPEGAPVPLRRRGARTVRAETARHR